LAVKETFTTHTRALLIVSVEDFASVRKEVCY